MRSCGWGVVNEYSCERSILDEAFEDEVWPFVNEVLWVRRCGEETFLWENITGRRRPWWWGRVNLKWTMLLRGSALKRDPHHQPKVSKYRLRSFDRLVGVWFGLVLADEPHDNQQRVVPKVLVARQHLLLFTTWNKRNRAELNYRDQRDCST